MTVKNISLSIMTLTRLTALIAVFMIMPLVSLPGGGTVSGGGQAWAQCSCDACKSPIASCSSTCVCTSNKQTKITNDHITESFKQHRKWMVDVFFKNGDKGEQSKRDTVPGLLEALQVMTSQLTTNAIDQIFMVGAMLDAKHQLETQRLFQQLTAEAHKDYHPSEGMCEVGTMTRSLATSARRADLSQITFAQRMNERQLLSGDTTSTNDEESEFWSRLRQFAHTFCNPADNGNGLANLCKISQKDKTRFNRDIDYTASVDLPLTLEIDFTPDGAAKTKDEENIFALSTNLYAYDPPPMIPETNLVNEKGEATSGVDNLMDLRAVAAKRSVAQNTLAAIVAQKTEGAPESKPFLYAALKEMSGEGISDDEIKAYLGKNPSYYAQMEMLGKKIYQHPGFYTELYDKPANVLRKEAAMQAIELMQKRDIYRSLLRSEALFSVILETSLADQQREIENKIGPLNQEGLTEKLE